MPAGWAIEAIKSRRLKISRLADMNDPFELLGLNLADPADRRAWSRTRKELDKTKGVLCFSRNWDNPVLWSHYADRHRGICLSFHVPDRLLLPVRYEAKRLPSQFAGRRLAGTLNEEFMKQILTTKFADWKYEDEVRAFCELKEKDEESGQYFSNFDENLVLKKVVLGARCNATQAELKPYLKDCPNSVTIVKVRLAFQSYRVVRQKREPIIRVGLTSGSRRPPQSGTA